LIFIVSNPLTAQQNEFATTLELFARLANKEVQVRDRAAELLAATNDKSVIPAFIEAIRYLRPNQAWHDAMYRLTGTAFGDDWNAWMEWLGQQNITPHPDYLEFKLAILERIDPKFTQFFYPGVPYTIRLDQIAWGGVRVDGIPALSNLNLLDASQAIYLTDDEPVFGIELNGDARAYPLRIMDWHEMLNDVIGGMPVSLAYCTLCGSAILFDAKVGDTVFTFGSSGLLYESNKLMYDHQTRSLWATLHGTPVVGQLVSKGIQLKRLPVVRTSWKMWKASHPETKVLSLETGYKRDYTPGAAYGKYFESDETMFPVSRRNSSLEAKEWVFGIVVNGKPKAYPLKFLRERPVVNDTVGGAAIIILSDAERLTVRVYERGERRFMRQEGLTLFDDMNQSWHITEEYLEQPDSSKRLARLSGHLAFWFGWYAFFPHTEVFAPM
jgi:hypothetical protein